MNQSDAQTMQSYPSPSTGPADNSVNYYSNQGPSQSSNLNSDELQLTAQLSRSVAPNMNAGVAGNAPDGQEQRGQGNANHTYEHHGLPTHPSQLHSPHDGNEHMGGYHAGDSEEAPRKRSKISRACDECRRKKIKCDATGEDSSEICTNCKRVNNRCAFTRQPMKRGPSKGYVIPQ